MIDDHDFIIDTQAETRRGPESRSRRGADAAPPEPRVIIEYRSRGLSATLGPPV